LAIKPIFHYSNIFIVCYWTTYLRY
jgi:hypothetical protein